MRKFYYLYNLFLIAGQVHGDVGPRNRMHEIYLNLDASSGQYLDIKIYHRRCDMESCNNKNINIYVIYLPTLYR